MDFLTIKYEDELFNNEMCMQDETFINNIKNLQGTFAIEGMSISKSSMANLIRLETGEATCEEIIEEIKIKYTQKV